MPVESCRAAIAETMTEPDPKQSDDSGEALDPVEEASKESFPASDAPSWEPLHPGAPPRKHDAVPDPKRSEREAMRDRPIADS